MKSHRWWFFNGKCPSPEIHCVLDTGMTTFNRLVR
jgi:hypothetical protein